MNCIVKRSKRKTVALEISSDGNLIVRAPLFYPQNAIDALIESKKSWIENAILRVKKRSPPKSFTKDEITEKKLIAKQRITPRVEYFSKLMGLFPIDVKITSAKKRFGSCSPKNSLCFSFVLADYPDTSVDYVVIHELAHIKYKNHGKQFYRLIERYMPDYKTAIKEMRNFEY